MNQDELVEAIISEVKRVLAQRGITVAPSSKESPAPARHTREGDSTPAAPSAAGQVPAAESSAAIGITDMSGRQVITQKELEPYKGQTIVVSRKAIFTPLAVDFAREKKITITRAAETSLKKTNSITVSATGASVALTISPDFRGDGSILKTILASKSLSVKEFSGGSYEANIKKVADAVAQGSVHFGVCLENTGMIGPIHANRNTRIRAVHCRDTLDARAARVDIEANVIVLDSASNPEAIISGFTGL
jgi:hypothetical protein